MTEKEVWLSIPGWDHYQVSSLGRLRRITLPSRRRYMVPTYGTITRKYREFHLKQDGRNRMARVHVLICETFHGPRPSPKHQVCHRDGNGLNNRARNLRWGLPVENHADLDRHGRRLRGEMCPWAKLKDSDIRAIRRTYPTLPHRKAGLPRAGILAAEFGISPTTVLDIVKRRKWSHL